MGSARKTTKRNAAIVSVMWSNPFTHPPEHVETLEDGRTLWACTILDLSQEYEKTTREKYGPHIKPGCGWSSCWSPVFPPVRRWSPEKKAQARKRNLRRRLEKQVPLFADQYEAEELARRPAYFDPIAIAVSSEGKKPMQPYIALTFGDHKQNGVHQIAKWFVPSKSIGMDLAQRFNAEIPADAVPDVSIAEFTFILDVFDSNGDFEQPANTVCLPMQDAMRHAPEQVKWWLENRPDPNDWVKENDWFVPDLGGWPVGSFEAIPQS